MMMDGLLMAALALVLGYLQVAAAGDIRGEHQSRGPPTRPAQSPVEIITNTFHMFDIRYHPATGHCNTGTVGRCCVWPPLHHVTMA